MKNQTYTLIFSEEELRMVDSCMFMLGYLSSQAAALDEIHGGLAAVTDMAYRQADRLSGRLYAAMHRQHSHTV